MSKQIYSTAIFLTDKDNIILDMNELAKAMVKKEEVIGKTIEEIDKLIDKKIFLNSDLKNYKVYIVREDKDVNGFLEYILDNSYDEIFITDGKGIALYCNNAFEKHYGIKKEDVMGKDVNFLVETGVVDRILVNNVIDTKQTVSFKQHTATGKTILNTLKPILDEDNEVIYVVENCRDISENAQLKNAIKLKDMQIKEMVNSKKFTTTVSGSSPVNYTSKEMKNLEKTIKKMSIKDVNILILGESGTGKTFMANEIHNMSLRKNAPFITINCTTIPKDLMESELFGYEKGSFTGALREGKTGLVAQANGGTLFLDEIGELPFNVQSKLLQLVQEKSYTPVGSHGEKTIDVRIIAATNKNLAHDVEVGNFREDLYYRLALGVIEIPTLRSRREDVKILIDYYLDLFNEKYDSDITLSREVLEIFLSYNWPGNIRELEHLLEFLIIDALYENAVITRDDLPIAMLKDKHINEGDIKEEFVRLNEKNSFIDFNESVEEFKKYLVKREYEKYENTYKVAEALSIPQSTAFRLVKKYCR